ncbi:MAG: TIGR02757 family protein [Candidatus Gastranaerophilales bacterium]|nr:TIGR02757 family protein [Candidatus Gastranaerophilales bacterium]
MKDYLEKLRAKYETPDFIKDDPVQFPHRFNGDIENIEIAGFITSLFSYGRREAFISKLNFLFEIMGKSPLNFILNFDLYENKLDGFCYRFYTDYDVKALFYSLSELYKSGRTIRDLFYKKNTVYDFFSSSKFAPKNGGFSFMICNPEKNGANKRMHLFLRWMVRPAPVDFGIWDFIDKKDLIIPLDVHAGNVSRKLGLLKRKQNDFKAAWELTSKLKEFRPDDPVGLDFALFGAGIHKENSRVLIL